MIPEPERSGACSKTNSVQISAQRGEFEAEIFDAVDCFDEVGGINIPVEVKARPAIADDFERLGTLDEILWKSRGLQFIPTPRIDVADGFWDAFESVGIAINAGGV